MDENKSFVYAKVDERNRITAIDGGYTISNIKDFSEWVYIDEGVGDRYNLCQSNYLPKPITDDRGIYQYKLVDGKPAERTQAEKDEDAKEASKIHAIRNIVKDEYFIVGGQMYKALCNIPNGGEVITGQNAVETNLEQQLNELAEREKK